MIYPDCNLVSSMAPANSWYIWSHFDAWQIWWLFRAILDYTRLSPLWVGKCARWFSQALYYDDGLPYVIKEGHALRGTVGLSKNRDRWDERKCTNTSHISFVKGILLSWHFQHGKSRRWIPTLYPVKAASGISGYGNSTRTIAIGMEWP